MARERIFSLEKQHDKKRIIINKLLHGKGEMGTFGIMAIERKNQSTIQENKSPLSNPNQTQLVNQRNYDSTERALVKSKPSSYRWLRGCQESCFRRYWKWHHLRLRLICIETRLVLRWKRHSKTRLWPKRSLLSGWVSLRSQLEMSITGNVSHLLTNITNRLAIRCPKISPSCTSLKSLLLGLPPPKWRLLASKTTLHSGNDFIF